jgi:(R,R)-butanediol dehydrogenase/meso-butanediol dehydrogenase/diacetyl reductase
MKALRWHGRGDIRLDEVPEPYAKEDEVKIAVKWCGICGSDINEYTSGPIIIPVSRPHPMTGRQAPITLGHELSGAVVEVGSGVADIQVGDRVAVRSTLPCYQCYYCRRGRYVLCSTLATIGIAADGGFAQYIVVPSDNLYKLPDQISFEFGSFCEPLAVGIHACNKAGVVAGDNVAVIGAGPIGLLVLQAAIACGAGQVFVIEPIAERRDVALRLGAAAVFDLREGNIGREIAKLTEGLRAAVTFECAGVPAAMLTALNISEKGGKIIEVGYMTKPCEFPFSTLFSHDKSIIAAQGYDQEFATAITFIASGRINCEPIITEKIELNNIIERGFEELTGERKNNHLKILVSPG